MNEDLEMYLMQVARQLRGLPPQQREAELREIESHLTTMVEARQLEGADYQSAVEQTLRQFGNARHVGRRLMEVWQRRQPENPLRAVGAALAVVLWQYAFPLLLSGIFLVLLTNTPPGTPYLTFHGVSLTYPYMALTVIVTPLGSGALAAFIAPRRGLTAALTVTVGEFLYSMRDYLKIGDIFQFDPWLAYMILASPLALLGLFPGVWWGRHWSLRWATRRAAQPLMMD